MHRKETQAVINTVLDVLFLWRCLVLICLFFSSSCVGLPQAFDPKMKRKLFLQSNPLLFLGTKKDLFMELIVGNCRKGVWTSHEVAAASCMVTHYYAKHLWTPAGEQNMTFSFEHFRRSTFSFILNKSCVGLGKYEGITGVHFWFLWSKVYCRS